MGLIQGRREALLLEQLSLSLSGLGVSHITSLAPGVQLQAASLYYELIKEKKHARKTDQLPGSKAL